MKWRKYLRLVNYGLITEEELASTIFRYPFSGREVLRNDIRSRLQEDAKAGERALYVLKLVPLDRQGQLPNLIVQSPRDLNEFDRFISLHSHIRASEIWYCRTPVDPKIFS